MWKHFTCYLFHLFQVEVSASDQPVNLLVLEPPDFPDLLLSFRQSLTASEKLRHLVSEVGSMDPDLPCVCRWLSRVNWTQFIERPSTGGWLSEVLLSKDCSAQSLQTVIEPSMIAVGNWTLEPRLQSAGGMVDQGGALIIGISAGLTIALSVGIILVVCR